MKKIPTMNPEYSKIVDEIIAEKLPVHEALMEIFKRCYGVSITTVKGLKKDEPISKSKKGL